MTAVPQRIAALQDDCVGALWAETATERFTSSLAEIERRFGICRNSGSRLIEAMASRYPVVRKLLWDDAFERVAARYISMARPQSPLAPEFGASFPGFLRTIGEGVAVDYLADIAELEWARIHAYHAPDATPLARNALAAMLPARCAELRLQFHPSMVLLASRFPAVSIWRSHQDGGDGAIRAWQPESSLIVRPRFDVEVWRLAPGGYEFLCALMAGHVVADARSKAVANAAAFDLADTLATLMSAEAVTGWAVQRPLRDAAGAGP
jgi:hypothetical protein